MTGGIRSSWVRALSWLVIGAGAILLLYVAYLMVWTNVLASSAARGQVVELERTWRASSVAPATAAPPAPALPAPAPGAGEAFALMSIPRLGEDWVQPVIEGSGSGGAADVDGSPGMHTGVGADDLRRGVVHYPSTALPGHVGNFAVAGHRATNGEPFRDLDRMREGDAVVVLTGSERLTYRVTGTEIVSPRQVDVLASVPGRPGGMPDGKRLTLTTCHPRWSSDLRLIVFGTLTDRRPARLSGPSGR